MIESRFRTAAPAFASESDAAAGACGCQPIGIGDAWRLASRQLDRLDARLLIEHICGCTHADLLAHPEKPLSGRQLAALTALIMRRVRGEPIAYLLGSADFYGLRFRVSPAVLVPRPETELLVELALAQLRHREQAKVLDLGTGSGVLAISLARLSPKARLTAVDLSPAALAVARDNAAWHAVEVEFLLGDWFAPVGERRFDLIVANPPYVADGDPHLLGDGLPFEPAIALTDGVPDGDGLACLRQIVGAAGAHLLPGGCLLVEHGHTQAANVRRLLEQAGFSTVTSWRDLAGVERVSGGGLP